MTSPDISSQKTRQILSSANLLLAIIAFSRLIFPFLTHSDFGIFRDELYYLACADHLDFGYVDQPPFIAVVTFAWRALFGDSLHSIRMLAAIAGAITVFLSGLLVRQLGGGRFAEILTAVTVLLSPVLLALSNMLSMNVFEVLFWTLGAYVVALILNTGNQKLWLLFGLIVGVGLENKHSMIFFTGGLTLGLMLTPLRHSLRSRWFWLGALIAFFIFLPNIIWQTVHGWPTLEFAENASQYKNLPLSPISFIGNQILEIHPFAFPLLLAGLYFFFGSGKKYRVFGWTYLVIFLFFLFTRSKTYYISPLYPLMLAGGAVAFGRFIDRRSWEWMRPASLVLMIFGGAITLPLVIPVLSIDSFIRYAKTLGVSGTKSERHQIGKLPQLYADMVGWEELTATVATVYHSLPPAEQAKCAIFGSNYGESGAIDYFGKKYGLPKAIGRHNSYWIWGPRDFDGEVIITIGESVEDVRHSFEDVQLAAMFSHPYVMPYENNLPIVIGRKPKASVKELWPQTRRFI